MTGTIGQFVSLTCYGNAFLRGKLSETFWPSNSTFQFCDRVNFVEASKTIFGRPKETQVAEDPNHWFEYLEKIATRGLRLFWKPRNDDPKFPDRMSVAFVGGGGTWMLETISPKRNGLWQSRWEVWNQNAPNRKIWCVTYGRVGEGILHFPKQDLEIRETKLRDSLQEIHGFSVQNKLNNWSEHFKRALDTLDDKPHDVPAYHGDIAPNRALRPKAARILEASQHAWVFGGMGSWNDLGFDGGEQQAYERVSENLFQSLHEAIPAAANDSFDEEAR